MKAFDAALLFLFLVHWLSKVACIRTQKPQCTRLQAQQESEKGFREFIDDVASETLLVDLSSFIVVFAVNHAESEPVTSVLGDPTLKTPHTVLKQNPIRNCIVMLAKPRNFCTRFFPR